MDLFIRFAGNHPGELVPDLSGGEMFVAPGEMNEENAPGVNEAFKHTAQSPRGTKVGGGMRRMDGRFYKGGKKVLWHFWNKSFKMPVTMAVFFFCAKRDTRCNLAPAPGRSKKGRSNLR